MFLVSTSKAECVIKNKFAIELIEKLMQNLKDCLKKVCRTLPC